MDVNAAIPHRAPKPGWDGVGIESTRKGRIRMAKFMYLFRNGPIDYRTISPEQMQQLVKKWMDWRNELEKDRHIKVLGDRMEGTGKVIRGRTKTVTDGPYVEVKDFIQGYMLLEAADLNQAVELAKGCPILQRDGSVEVRPFVSA